MKKSKIIYIDLDDVLADFAGAARDPESEFIREHMMWDHNFFLNLSVMPGAQGGVFELMKMGFDVWILSQPLADKPESYVEKAKWVHIHFPQLYKKIILTQDKSLCKGDYLIDDNHIKWGAKFTTNGGFFYHFKYGGYNGPKSSWIDPKDEWRKVVEFFSTQDPYKEQSS